VQPLAARGFHKSLELHARKPLLHLARGGDHVFPARARPRIEIEHQPVGALAVIDRGAAGVDFQNAGLHQRDQTGEIVDGNNLVALLGHKMQVLGSDAGRGVFLEKTLPSGALRAAQQRDRPADHMRAHPLPNLAVEICEIVLADAGILPIDAVGMA